MEQTNELPNQIKSIACTYIFFDADRGRTINTSAFPVPSRRNDLPDKDLEMAPINLKKTSQAQAPPSFTMSSDNRGRRLDVDGVTRTLLLNSLLKLLKLFKLLKKKKLGIIRVILAFKI